MIPVKPPPEPDPPMICGECREHIAVVTSRITRRLLPARHEHLDGLPLVLVIVNGGRIDVRPEPDAQDVVLRALRGRLVGPADACRPVVEALVRHGLGVVVSKSAETGDRAIALLADRLGAVVIERRNRASATEA